MKKIVIAGGALVLVVVIYVGYTLYTFVTCLGGGSLQQHAPDSVSSDEPVVIGLEIYLGPCETEVEDEFKDVKLYYRLVGEEPYHELIASKIIPKGQSRDVYEFQIAPQGRIGRIEYYFNYKRIGKGEQIEGYKQIQLNNSPKR